VSIWKQKQGDVHLAIQSNQIYNSVTNDYEAIGLPYGTKARLFLMHINTIAIQTKSPFIHMENSLTAFMKQLKMDTNGRNMTLAKDTLRRLMVSNISLGYRKQEGGGQQDLKIIRTFEEAHTSQNQHLSWTSSIRLSDDYFNSLTKHAIPLDRRAIHTLSHNAMALDIYTWLAQRLLRVDKRRPQFIPWAALKIQFGREYHRMYDFKRIFRKYLQIVKMQYPKAKIQEEKNKGFFLHYSPPPIGK